MDKFDEMWMMASYLLHLTFWTVSRCSWKGCLYYCLTWIRKQYKTAELHNELQLCHILKIRTCDSQFLLPPTKMNQSERNRFLYAMFSSRNELIRWKSTKHGQGIGVTVLLESEMTQLKSGLANGKNADVFFSTCRGKQCSPHPCDPGPPRVPQLDHEPLDLPLLQQRRAAASQGRGASFYVRFNERRVNVAQTLMKH